MAREPAPSLCLSEPPARKGQRTAPGRQKFDSQEDLFEDREEYFEQATPYGDTLYTPAPLIGLSHDFLALRL